MSCERKDNRWTGHIVYARRSGIVQLRQPAIVDRLAVSDRWRGGVDDRGRTIDNRRYIQRNLVDVGRRPDVVGFLLDVVNLFYDRARRRSEERRVGKDC